MTVSNALPFVAQPPQVGGSREEEQQTREHYAKLLGEQSYTDLIESIVDQAYAAMLLEVYRVLRTLPGATAATKIVSRESRRRPRPIGPLAPITVIAKDEYLRRIAEGTMPPGAYTQRLLRWRRPYAGRQWGNAYLAALNASPQPPEHVDEHIPWMKYPVVLVLHTPPGVALRERCLQVPVNILRTGYVARAALSPDHSLAPSSRGW